MQARYQPSSQAPGVGGDWYDVIHLPDRVACLMVGDVMGHDLRAATVMSQISNMLRVIAFDPREPPSRILQRLDRALHELHGGPMATVIVVRLEGNGAGRRLRWASAGHLPPLLAVPGEPADHADRPLPQLCDTLLTHCRQACEHDAFEDDVALLAARLAPRAP